MSEETGPSIVIPSRPFSFKEGWFDEGQHWTPPAKPDFVAQRVKALEHMAKCAENAGDAGTAERATEGVAWWRGLATFKDDSAEEAAASEALRAFQILFVRANAHSEQAITRLREITDMLLSNLYTLAAHGDKKVANHWLNALTSSTNNFNILACRRRELFLPETRHAFGVPGIISAFTEKTKSNALLTKLLQVGEDFIFKLPRGKKRGKAVCTPVNLWAVRLIAHIVHTRYQLAHYQQLPREQKPNPFLSDLKLAPWLGDAIALKDFSSETWESWFEVAWKIVLEATNGRPEKEPCLLQIGAAGNRKKGELGKKGMPRKQDGNVRATIIERLKKAFQNFANAR